MFWVIVFSIIAGIIAGYVASAHNYYDPLQKILMVIGIILCIILIILYPDNDWAVQVGVSIGTMLLTVLITNPSINPVH